MQALREYVGAAVGRAACAEGGSVSARRRRSRRVEVEAAALACALMAAYLAFIGAGLAVGGFLLHDLVLRVVLS